ncbi:hypothetical protein D3C78_843250 [compost metagenome]
MPEIRNGSLRRSTETDDDHPALRVDERLGYTWRRQFTAPAGRAGDEQRSRFSAFGGDKPLRHRAGGSCHAA